ncbi:MAG: tRNA pseudouridine(38-40) synthase TruA [Chlamydiae bacterium]|nr:tRNA pseudouridine(38-40) synthase TruA [Chlamydiota bacterium]
MTRFKLKISYDGTRFGGWQIQPNAISIQEEIEKVLYTLYQKKIPVTGSGRTDAKVHALGQIAHIDLEIYPKSLDRLLKSLNQLLPKDIRVLHIEETAPDFHARFSAKGKTYRYHFSLLPCKDPFRRLYCYYHFQPTSLEKIKGALDWFSGTRDFRSFANECHKGSAASSPIKTLQPIKLLEIEEGYYAFEFTGSGFLYKMVRNITGTLFEIGAQKLNKTDVDEIFLKLDRKFAPKTAPPHGLFLVDVYY